MLALGAQARRRGARRVASGSAAGVGGAQAAEARGALGRWAVRARGTRQGARPGRACAHGGHAG